MIFCLFVIYIVSIHKVPSEADNIFQWPMMLFLCDLGKLYIPDGYISLYHHNPPGVFSKVFQFCSLLDLPTTPAASQDLATLFVNDGHGFATAIFDQRLQDLLHFAILMFYLFYLLDDEP